MREIVLDTETTGMDPKDGHRIVEIGCIEVEDLLPTGRVLHQYINPERDVPPEAVNVHGITEEFLKDKPVMAECVGEFHDFIQGARLVIHNAEFDMKFINFELRKCGFPSFPSRDVLDTLGMARQKFPGSPANLDALCRRFGIDNSNRTLHGALLDAELLAEVYMELLGGRQHGFTFQGDKTGAQGGSGSFGTGVMSQKSSFPMRVFKASDEEAAAHKHLLSELDAPIWEQYK
jgi:DNA polymerase-3 subunit epsilon